MPISRMKTPTIFMTPGTPSIRGGGGREREDQRHTRINQTRDELELNHHYTYNYTPFSHFLVISFGTFIVNLRTNPFDIRTISVEGTVNNVQFL